MSDEKRVLIVSKKEFDFLLAAARLWQSPQGSAVINQDLLDIATRDGEHDEFTMDEIDTLCERINTEEPTLYLGTYEHRHGTDHELYLTREGAEDGREAIAQQEWASEMGDEPMPEDGAADRYFQYMGERDRGEWFHIEELNPKS